MRIFIFILLLIAVPCGMYWYQKTRFKAELWKKDETERSYQAENLIQSEILINKTYNEVVQLLGEQGLSFRHENKADIKQRNFTIECLLGHCPDFISIDFQRLAVEFKDGKVIKVYIYCN